MCGFRSILGSPAPHRASSQRKTGSGRKAKRVVGNHVAGSSQMAGELEELNGRFNSETEVGAPCKQSAGSVNMVTNPLARHAVSPFRIRFGAESRPSHNLLIKYQKRASGFRPIRFIRSRPLPVNLDRNGKNA